MKEAYLKEKLEPRKMDVNYKGPEFSNTFNFSVEATKVPFGHVALKTGYNNDPKYESTFLMSYTDAMQLAMKIIEAADDAMKAKAISLDAESCESQLSFLVLKHLIDTIRIERTPEKLKNYSVPYYKYIVSAYKDKKKILSYAVVYNLSYFTSEKQIQFWIDRLTDKERVKIYFDNWNPFTELEERKVEYNTIALRSIDENLLNKYTRDIKPIPIIKENLNKNQ